MILIKQHSRYVYDIFIGNGWEEWLRVRKNNWGLTSLNGVVINKDFSLKLEKLLETHPHGNVDAVA